MRYSNNYLNWVASEKERCAKMNKEFKPLTLGQYKFAEWCLINPDEVGKLGDMTRIFDSVSHFIKHNSGFEKVDNSEDQRKEILKAFAESQYDFDYGYGKTGVLNVRMVDRNKASHLLMKLFSKFKSPFHRTKTVTTL